MDLGGWAIFRRTQYVLSLSIAGSGGVPVVDVPSLALGLGNTRQSARFRVYWQDTLVSSVFCWSIG